MMNGVLRNYSEQDLRNLFDTHILSKNVNTNPFNLAGLDRRQTLDVNVSNIMYFI